MASVENEIESQMGKEKTSKGCKETKRDPNLRSLDRKVGYTTSNGIYPFSTVQYPGGRISPVPDSAAETFDVGGENPPG